MRERIIGSDANFRPLQTLQRRAIVRHMPFFRFLIHGWDPSLPKDTKGFFTTRHVYAADEHRAAQKVRARIIEEFTNGASADIWGSGTPHLSIEEAYRIGLHQLRSGPNKGSTFYGLAADEQ